MLLALAACAPLSAATMSDRCREDYDACLDACRPPPGPPPSQPALAQRPNTSWQVDVASCTSDCNTKAQSCR